VRGNRIYNGKASGIYIYDSGTGLLEDNDIHSHAYAGVAISTTTRAGIILRSRRCAGGRDAYRDCARPDLDTR